MASNPQVLGLLEEMLDEGKTPEEVCRGCPGLLAEVRERWREFRLIDAAVVELLPGLQTTPDAGAVTSTPTAADPTEIPGYELLGEVGRGGMGIVYRARDVSLDRDVAVKFLQDKFRADSPIVRRFTDESRITAQLQHPGVPPVYRVGALPDGRPFLAMKLIKGRTLADMLNERSDPAADRGSYVAIFEQVCQAVAYAHSLRVIHRDLKPSNVMVGKFGEVQVMDWGVAKVLPEGFSTSESKACGRPPFDDGTVIRSRLPTPDTPGDAGAPTPPTRAGSVLGTPAYMAPEQASGEVDRLDTRSDVFGLGAILCEVLTSQPPYTSRDQDEIVRMATYANQVDAHARLADCGAEPELVALCTKCLAPKPHDRPRDAGEVATAVAALRAAAEERARRAELDRVRTAEEGKRRRVLLAASAAIVAVLLAGLGVSLWQMFRATEAESQANQNLQAELLARQDEAKARQQAFKALRSMTAGVLERKFAQGAKLTQDDRAFLRGIIAQFDAFAAIKGDDAESRAVRAEGRFRVGAMRYSLGEHREALECYDQAHNIYQQLASEFPSNSEFRHELARCHSNRGLLLGRTGRLPDSEKDYHRALNIHKELAADFPARPDFRRSLAISLNNRGALLFGARRFQEAEDDFEQALVIQKQLAAEFPSQPEYREELASSHNNRGAMLGDRGRHDDAMKQIDLAVSIRKQLAAEFPARFQFHDELAASHINRGRLFYAVGKLPEAESEYEQAMSIYKVLAADYPTRPEFRHSLAKSYIGRGFMHWSAGRLKETEQDYDQALSIQRRLAVDFPDHFDWRSDLAATCLNQALVNRQQGDLTAAKRLLLESGPHSQAALKATPLHPGYRQIYRNQLGSLTAVHAELLEEEDAVRTAETCRDLGWDAPADAYNAACFLSLCVPIVAKHDALDVTQREEGAQFYGDAAMKLLRNAVSNGYKDVAHMKKEADLDPLRQRDDFRILVAELEGKGK